MRKIACITLALSASFFAALALLSCRDVFGSDNKTFAANPIATGTSTLSSDQPSQIRDIREPGDAGKGEHERIRSIFIPTGETLTLTIAYLNGTKLRYSYAAGAVQREEEFVPHPAKKGYYRKREAFLNVKTGDKIWQKLYRINQTLEQEDQYSQCCISRTKFAADGKTPVSKVLLDRATESPMLQHQQIYR